MPAMAQGTKAATGQTAAIANSSNGPITGNAVPVPAGVNRKKQKRRAKQAARQAAEEEQRQLPPLDATVRNGHVPHGHSTLQQPPSLHQSAQSALDYGDPDLDDPDQFEPVDGEDYYYTEDDAQTYDESYSSGLPPTNGHFADEYVASSDPRKGSKKGRKNKSSIPLTYPNGPASAIPPLPAHLSHPPPPPPPPLSNAALRSVQRSNNRDRIWNTSTQEERERIKEFWLSLGEEERKSLVKIEKEAVLRKMKEQQKHSCSCTVCGRKRTAIEEELEVLYDAYYEELEQYANHQQDSENGAPVLPPSKRVGQHFDRLPPDRMPSVMQSHHPPRNRIRELPDDEGDDEEELDDGEYSSDEDDEEYSDDEPEGLPRGPAADFFNFGNSLTVKGGILTVADDLLKNDGKKFIEMMEQLAERRMQREEEAQYSAAGLSHSSQNYQSGHNHGAPAEDDDYDDEEDDDYDSQEEDYEDQDEMDTMTEEQRMEEGRRMFQIFAARMFEQRVLTAYREKVARERQQKLLEELEEETRLDVQREAKKARDAQKKKDKKQQQKQAKAEEKARKEAEKAAEEAAAKAIEEQKQEEQRRKKEEQRKKKEAERKAQEEEKQRKEAERLKRLQEERERQQEAERRLREQKAQEKKAREEAKKKEREEREAKEKEAREKKLQEEKERKEREAKARAEKEAQERTRKAEQAAQTSQQLTQSAKRQSQPAAIALPPSLQTKQSSAIPSPHVQVATPALPKAPTPVRPRQSSLQGSHGSSPKTPQTSKPVKASSPGTGTHSQQSTVAPKTILTRPASQQPPAALNHPSPASPLPPIGPPPGMPPLPGAGFGIPPGINAFPPSQGPMMHGLTQRAPVGHSMPMYPHQPPPVGPQYRSFGPPTGMPGPPPGMAPPGMMPLGRGFPQDMPPGFGHQMPGMGAANQMPTFGITRDTMPSHSRQHSGSTDKTFEPPTSAPQAQPIARPAPIQRPASVKPQEGSQENKRPTNSEIDDLSNHLGSSALLDDTDEPIPTSNADNRRASLVPGLPRAATMAFGASPMFPNPATLPRSDSLGFGGSSASGSTWSTPTIPYGPPGMPTAQTWGSTPSAGWSNNNNNTFGPIGGQHRQSLSRPVAIRLMVCQACKQLTTNTIGSDGFHDVNAISRQIDTMRSANEAPVQINEILEICETEGDAQNGGGSFVIKREAPNRTLVKYESDNAQGRGGGLGLGEIGSPVPGHVVPASGGPIGSSRPFPSLGGVPPSQTF